MTACQVCGGRDAVEEFLAAKVWPLAAGWSPVRFERKSFVGLKYEVTSPFFGLRRPEGASDEVIVDELERRAAEILGPWNKKEYRSLVEVCGGNLRLNRCLAEMGVAYEPRPVPANAIARMTPPGNVGSEVPEAKSKGKAKAEVAGSSGSAGARGRGRGRKPSGSKVSVARAESAKRKAQDEEVSSGDSGTPSFMEELMGTVGGEIVVPEGRLFRSHYDLSDEYGTMLFGSGRRVEVAKALINLHCSSEGTTKRRRIQSLVKTGTKPADLPRPPVPKGAASTADVLKDSAPAPKVTHPSLNIEEGEVLVGETLMALRGGEARGVSSAPPSDREVEALEGMTFDESGKFHLLGFS